MNYIYASALCAIANFQIGNVMVLICGLQGYADAVQKILDFAAASF
jgi:hypothetical protein